MSDATPEAPRPAEPAHPDGRGEGPDEAAGAPGEGPHEDPREDPYEAAGPAPLGVGRTPTGRPAVDALLDRLAAADHLTADGHLGVYEDVHRSLRAELTALDAPRAPAPPRPYDNRS
ncbi:hypothetical protein ACGFRB_27605 [Streptomyces sp. NPDC048718]|uniref:hypothetical protein n=1 Tax=Streptomyces sp. NPDC048718 TaxID=3365587 RepID=UPI003710310D